MFPHCQHFLSDGRAYDVFDGECGGVVSTLLYFGRHLPASVRHCRPQGVTQEQAVRVVYNYLVAHPELLHQDFRELAAVGLSQAWPCKS